MIKNKKILITGVAGSIGSELARQLCKDNEIFGLDNNEIGFFDLYEDLRLLGTPIKGRMGDIRNTETLGSIFHWFRPEIVFHAAAYKHVVPLEHNPREAAENNITGTLNVIEACKIFGVEKFVFISTDKVTSLNSVMGISKRFGELATRAAGYISVRFGNVMGSRGSVIPVWQKQISEGKPLTITDERMERFFMTIEEAVSLVVKASEIGQPGDILVMDMGKSKNILEMAKEILGKIGKPDYPIQKIGARHGEVMNERLMTEEEEKISMRDGEFFIIRQGTL